MFVHTPVSPDAATDLAGTASFDVFDTLITRRWMRPTELFIDVGRRLIVHGLVTESPEGWRLARVNAERALRAEALREEVRLEDIYRRLRASFGWSEAEAELAMELELQAELNDARSIAKGREALERERARGATVALISDTYFPRGFVMRLLDRCGISVEHERVFASSDHDATKGTGRLYEIVAKALAVEPRAIVHSGDNLGSDVRSALRAGLRARAIVTEPSRHEQALYRAAPHPLIMRSALAGSARAARLGRVFADDHVQTVWDTGTNVAGPLLCGFVLWLLDEARRRGIARLYFVARDGQVLLRIARALCAQLQLPIECRYLYGSRQAWHLPALESFDDAALDWLLSGAARHSVRHILARAELSCDEAGGVLERHGFARSTWDVPIGTLAGVSVQALLEEAELRDRILERAAACRDAARAYLVQEGFADGAPFGIVDIGWHGRLQRSLTRIINATPQLHGAEPLGFYLGLITRPSGVPETHVATYADVSEGSPNAAWRINPSLLEIFCAADHGTLRRYRIDADGVAGPVFAEERNGDALAWGLGVQQEAIEACAREIACAVAASDRSIAEWVALLRDAAFGALRAFKNDPTIAEATAFGRFRHAEDQAHHISAEFAPALSSAGALGLIVRPGAAGGTYWPEASLIRTAQTSRIGGMLHRALRLKRWAGTAKRTVLRRDFAGRALRRAAALMQRYGSVGIVSRLRSRTARNGRSTKR